MLEPNNIIPRCFEFILFNIYYMLCDFKFKNKKLKKFKKI